MKKMKKKKNLNKSIFCILTVFVLLFALAIPCFAYSPPLLIDGSGNIAVDTTRSFAFVNSDNQVVIYGYKFRAPTFDDYQGYNVYVDVSVLDIFGSIQYDTFTFIPLGSNIDLNGAKTVVNSYVQGVLNGSTGNAYNQAVENAYNQGVSSSDSYGLGFVAGQSQQYETDLRDVQIAFGTVPGSTWENVDDNISQSVSTSLSASKDSWLSEGKQGAYNAGYTDGLAEADVAETTILTIFSVPSYVLSTIFNFEIFGINLYALITFLLTITIVGTVIKKII